MTGAERGVLLLCASLEKGDRPLTMAQFRELSLRAQQAGMPESDPFSQVNEKELARLGYHGEEASRILTLLDREAALDEALARAQRRNILPLTRITAAYPSQLSWKLRMDCPPVLFFRGDARLLHSRCISVVGSRQLTERGRAFAQRAGELAALEGYTLVSGGADGADREAQEACLAAGGSVIVFTAGRLVDRQERERVLYVSEGGFDLPFSTIRAMQRNRLIHVMGEKTLVAQSNYNVGGTWHGSLDNLKHGWSPLYVCENSGEGATHLCEQGATPIKSLTGLRALEPEQASLFDQWDEE